MGEKLILQAFGERLKLAVGLVAEKYRPVHGGYYGCKAIWRQDHMPTTSSAPCQPRAGGKSLGRKRIANADRVRPGLAVPQLCLGETGKRIEPACRRKAHQDRTKRESPVAHGVPSCDSEFQMPDRRRSRPHLDFDVVAEPIQAIHQLPLRQIGEVAAHDVGHLRLGDAHAFGRLLLPRHIPTLP